MPEIRLDNLVKSYDGVVAADGLSLEVRDGEYMCVLGPTGAGKTTCLRMICGLTKQDSGTVSFDGVCVNPVPTSERHAAMLSQVYSLFPPLTVYDNVMFAPKIRGWNEDESKQLVRSMLKMVHMTHKAENYPRELSGGQQQRCALARALASDSKILLLDEPLRALDARLRLELRKELKSMAKEMGMPSIHVTHDQDEALEMADRIAIIRKGRIVQVGTPEEIFENPATPFVANFVGRSNVFLGRVVSDEGDASIIALKDGTKISARHTDVPVGEEVVVTVKVGFTRIAHPVSKKGDPRLGYFKARISRMMYEGATVTVEMDVPVLGIVTSKISNRRFDDYGEGEEVLVSWTPAHANVFTIPDCGIEEELRLD